MGELAGIPAPFPSLGVRYSLDAELVNDRGARQAKEARQPIDGFVLGHEADEFLHHVRSRLTASRQNIAAPSTSACSSIAVLRNCHTDAS